MLGLKLDVLVVDVLEVDVLEADQRGRPQSNADDVEATSGTAAVNVIIIEGTYKQSCRFKFWNGKFRCLKEPLG